MIFIWVKSIKKKCKNLNDLLGEENFKDLIAELIKSIKGNNLEMALRLFDLVHVRLNS